MAGKSITDFCISGCHCFLLAGKKFDNFAAYHALFPEYRVVFIGDSGQGDIMAGLQVNQCSFDGIY
jgi:hypothetical protein